MKKTVLTVDDEQNILELLRYNLEKAGFDVIQAATGEKAVEILSKDKVDIVLLDLMLPGMDGLEVLKWIRSQETTAKLPVIMLTAKSEEVDKVIGLELGADDYLAKPFGVRELMARIKAIFRRTDEHVRVVASNPEGNDEVLRVEDILINISTHEVFVKGMLIELSLKEFELLYLLAKNRGRVFEREYLLEKVWGYEFYGETRTVDVHIRNLRKKIEVDDSNPVYIKTVRGLGYKFG